MKLFIDEKTYMSLADLKIPVKFPDLSECMIATFHLHLLQIQCYDDCSLIQLVMFYIPLSGEYPTSNKSLVECILKYEFGFKVFHVLTHYCQIPVLYINIP